MKTKIIYFGTPQFAVPFFLELAKDSSVEIVAVVTQPDKPVGRKQILTKPELKVAAESLNIPVLQFPSLKSAEALQTLTQLHAELFIVVAYGKLIPQSILDLPKKGCVNVHPSLLPKYRGPSPLQNTILHGDKSSGISIMLLDAGMDTGPILAQTVIELDSRETFSSFEQKIFTVGPTFYCETIQKWIHDEIVPIAQNDAGVTITSLLERVDGKIDWNKSALEIDRKIRAFETWPGTWFSWNENGTDVRIAVHQAIVSDRVCIENIGSVVIESNHLFIVCGDHHAIELLELQPDGKNKMSADAYARGHKTILETSLI